MKVIIKNENSPFHLKAIQEYGQDYSGKQRITVVTIDDRDYISLTDMANAKESESRAADIIKNWLRTRYTLEFLGTWELIHNPILKWWNLTTLKCFVNENMRQGERLLRSNKIAIQQMQILQEVENRKLLK